MARPSIKNGAEATSIMRVNKTAHAKIGICSILTLSSLTIFSYIEHQLTAFTIDSIVIMGVVIIAEIANERMELFQNSLLDKKSHDESM